MANAVACVAFKVSKAVSLALRMLTALVCLLNCRLCDQREIAVVFMILSKSFKVSARISYSCLSLLSWHDDFLLCLLQQANLDTLWGRETSTIAANHRNLNQLIQLWCFWVTATVAMLAMSTEPGCYKEHTQYETIRKLRSVYSNLFHASAVGSGSMVTLGVIVPRPSFPLVHRILFGLRGLLRVSCAG
jgi:hypothetical protein